jgi:D-beta-D-heptose 7-phosphate kinase/D-beta-D-heptose 1-phosphate adenosyltransferase
MRGVPRVLHFSGWRASVKGRIPNWQGLEVLVVGDLMLDRFIHGEVRRISPEAPIPIVEVTLESSALGGAANVAHNLASLGAKPLLIGAVGDDTAGGLFMEALQERGLDLSGVMRVKGRTTTVKTRILAHHQQVVRVDREVRSPLPENAAEKISRFVLDRLPAARALVVSDYAKGVLTPELLQDLGPRSRELGIPYVVDPKPAHFPYPGATVVTPNRGEAAGFFGRRFTGAEIFTVADYLLSRTDWDAILLTLGEEGMALCERGKKIKRIQAKRREVFDVTGAGDTVVAVVALGLAAGDGLLGAATLANAAAGVVVGKMGTSVCTPEELGKAFAEPRRDRPLPARSR